MVPTDEDLALVAGQVVTMLADAGETVAAAESCTGGWVAKALTDIAGSSAVFGLGLVTYSNAAKQQFLNVPDFVLDKHGAVSRETVAAMAEGSGRDLRCRSRHRGQWYCRARRRQRGQAGRYRVVCLGATQRRPAAGHRHAPVRG